MESGPEVVGWRCAMNAHPDDEFELVLHRVRIVDEDSAVQCVDVPLVELGIAA